MAITWPKILIGDHTLDRIFPEKEKAGDKKSSGSFDSSWTFLQ